MVIELLPGGSHTFAVTVTPPSHLTEDGGWYFGGYIEFSDIMEGLDMAGPLMCVPYMGYKGNYTDISVFVPRNPADRDVVSVVNSGTPVLTYMCEATEVVEGRSYELTQEKSIYLSFSMLRPSRILTVKLVDEDSGKAVGYLPYGYNEYMGYYGDPKENVLISPFNGLAFTDIKEPRLQEIRWLETYYVQIKSLCLFGDTKTARMSTRCGGRLRSMCPLIGVKSNYTGPGKELLQF
ncbi:hypothetical protein EV182_000523 [Spiromyces aspiralis]|uniref:Uncharacterized protein n=1 Tax=Spiromyces aspiralis TaxID=68401 RepID=A0ACC1HV32_9FUNG|nr:hypothetical protein EV182_000523 [Spiromyces aspiralis]